MSVPGRLVWLQEPSDGKVRLALIVKVVPRDQPKHAVVLFSRPGDSREGESFAIPTVVGGRPDPKRPRYVYPDLAYRVPFEAFGRVERFGLGKAMAWRWSTSS